MNETQAILFSDNDRTLMRRALELAHEGRYTCSPNPRVGCVIARYNKDGPLTILGEGYHQLKGEPHAERLALAACTENPRGAIMAVTLEPCCHYGSTPPCTDAILEAGIGRAIVAVEDPFPAVRGQGIALLRERGVTVDTGLMRDEARYENRFFFHRHETGLPWVILKAAMSLDGKLASWKGHSKWITGETARAHVHRLRGEADAILVGAGTAKSDNPTLTARIPDIPAGGSRQPTRVVLDPQLSITQDSNLYKTRHVAPVRIFCCRDVSDNKIESLAIDSVKVTPVGGDKEKLDLRDVLVELANSDVLSVIIEGGPNVHTSFLESGLVNELFIYIAPVVVGGSNAPTFYMGRGADTIQEAIRLKSVERLELGCDTLIHGVMRDRLAVCLSENAG